jgi:hypothetical protein
MNPLDHTINDTIYCAYLTIVNYSKKLISSIPEEPLRQILEKTNNSSIKINSVIHELISPLVYLRLDCSKKGAYQIHYGYEQTDIYIKHYPVTSAFIRSIYRYTDKKNTVIDIEDCIHTDWVITNCAELFEYIGDRNKHHVVSTLAYKPEKQQKRVLQTVNLP